MECDLSEYASPRNMTKLVEDQSSTEIHCAEVSAIEFNETKKIELKLEDDCQSDSGKETCQRVLINEGLVFCPGTGQFIINDELSYDKNGYDLDPEDKPEILSLYSLIKEENTDDTQSRHTSGPEFYIKSEEIEIKSENADMTVETIKSDQSEDCNNFEKNNCSINRKRQSQKSASKEEKQLLYFCPKCPYSSNKNTNFKRHIGSHSDNEEHKCSLCPYVADARLLLRAHMKTHWKLHHDTNTEGYKCNQCLYSTKFSYNFIRHQLKHKKPEEIMKYKCEKCEYETKYKDNLTKHMVIHDDPTVSSIFKCEKCPYWGRRLYKLKIHMRVHERPYSWKKRTYSIIGDNLLQQTLVYQKDRERRMYKCKVCSYQTRYRAALRNHIIAIHTDPSKLPRLKCARCPYETVLRKSLLSHMRRLHCRKGMDQPMRKCGLCFYVTRDPSNMRRHSLVHQEPTLQCYHCDYQARQKSNLSKHIMNVHSIKNVQRCENVEKN